MKHTYRRADLGSLELSEPDTESCNVVFSSLAFAYLDNVTYLIWLVHRVPKTGGNLVFNDEHSIIHGP